MRNPGGLLVVSDPDARREHEECDTFTCGHACNKVVKVKPFCDPADLGGMCRGCGKLICAECHAKGTCTPIEKWLEEHEKLGHSQAGKDAIEQAMERQRARASYE